MAITQSDITSAVKDGSAILYTGTVAVAPSGAGATVISVTSSASVNLHNNTHRDKYLFFPDNNKMLRKITNISDEIIPGGSNPSYYDVTVDFPFDLHEFRGYTRADGTAFVSTAPAVGDKVSISLDGQDMSDIVQDTNLSATGFSVVDAGIDAWRVTDTISLPTNCAFVMDRGTLEGSSLLVDFIMNTGNDTDSVIRFGRLHGGDPNDISGDYYTSNSVAVVDEQLESVGIISLQPTHSIQFVKGYLNLTRSVTPGDGGASQFLRMYNANNLTTEKAFKHMLIDWQMIGNIGIRIAGDDSFIKDFTYQDGAWRGINFRVASSSDTIGQISGLRTQDSDGLFYQFWSDSSDETIVDGFTVVNPAFDSSNDFGLVENFGNSGTKEMTLKNWDVTKWRALEATNTAIKFSVDNVTITGSQNLIHAARDIDIKTIDSSSNALDTDNPPKLFIYTQSSSSHASFGDLTYTDTITDGGEDFTTQTVKIRTFRPGAPRRFAATPGVASNNDIEYVNTTKPGNVSVRARRYNTSIVPVELLSGDGGFSSTVTMLDDPFHSDETLATINAYTELETAQKTYDYAKRTVYDFPGHVNANGEEEFFSDFNQTSDILTPTTAQDIRLSVSNLTGPYSDLAQDLIVQGTDNITIRTSTDTTQGSTTAGFHIPDNDLYIYNTIKGYVNCNNIMFTSGNQITTGSTIIDTEHTVSGTMALSQGEYTITGGARVGGLNINRAGTEGTVTVSLVDYVESDGIPTAGDNVVIQRAVEVTYQLEEDFVSGDLKYYATEYKDSDDSEVAADVTATVSQDNTNNTVTLKFDIGHDSYIQIAVYYKGYKIDFIRTTEGSHDVTLVKYLSSEMDVNAITTGDNENGDTAFQDYFDGTSEDNWAFIFGSNKLTITAPSTVINLTEPVAKAMMYFSLAGETGDTNKAFLENVSKGNLEADVLDFNNLSAVVKAGDLGESLHNTIIFNHASSNGVTRWNTQVLDTENEDASAFLSTTTLINEIRFLPKKDLINVGSAVSDKFAADVATELNTRNVKNATFTNLGLGLPIVNDAGDAFETTPTTPS